VTIEEIRSCSRLLTNVSLRDLLRDYAVHRKINNDDAQRCVSAYIAVMRQLGYIEQAAAEHAYRYNRLLMHRLSPETMRNVIWSTLRTEQPSDLIGLVAEAVRMPYEYVSGLCEETILRYEQLSDYFRDADDLLMHFGVDPEGGYQDYQYQTAEGYALEPIDSIMAKYDNE